MAFSPNGRLLVTGSQDQTVKLWDTRTGFLLRTFIAQGGDIASVVFSPDGRSVISADQKSITFWDVTTGAIQRRLAPQDKKYRGVAISADGQTLAATDWDSVRLWDANSGALRRELKVDWVEALALSRDGRRLITGGGRIPNKSLVRVWDTTSGKLLKTITSAGPAGVASKDIEIEFVAFSADERAIICQSEHTQKSRMTQVFDAASGRELRKLASDDGDGQEVSISADRRTIAVLNEYVVRLLDVAKGTELQTFNLRQRKIFTSRFALSPNGRSLALASLDDSPRFLDLAGAVDVGGTLLGNRGYAVSVTSDGQSILARDGDKRLRVWDSRTGRQLQSFPIAGPGYAAVFSADGSLLANTVWTKSEADRKEIPKLKIFNTSTGRELQTLDFDVGTYYLNKMVFAPDRRSILTLASKPDARGVRLQLWDVQTGKELRSYAGCEECKSMLAMSADGRTFATAEEAAGNEYRIKIWDVESGRELRSLVFAHIGLDTIAYAPVGQQLVIASAYIEHALFLRDAATGDYGRTLRGATTNHIKALAFSPDGKSLLAGGEDNIIRMWDVETGRQLQSFVGHSGEILSIAFSPDGKTVVSTGYDSTLRRWNLDGTLLTTSIATAAGEWLTITPEGFFDASAKGADILAVVKGLETFGIGQLYQSLYRPDLVREKLAGDPRGLVRTAAATLDLNKVVASGRAPVVRLSRASRALTPSVDSTDTPIQAEITDDGGGVGHVEWRVNGVTAGVDDPAASTATEPLRLSRSLSLDSGDNVVEVVAYNSANLVASIPARLDVSVGAAASVAPSLSPLPGAPPAAPSTAKPRLFVLAAGVNAYADPRIKLSFALSDAEAIARGFHDAAGDLYELVEVKLMTDADVRRDTLDAAFSEIAAKTRASDVFVLYLAGHGKTVDGRYYFIPQDFKVDGELSESAINAAVKTRAIAQDQLQRWFASIGAHKSVILFDTCDSGTLTGDAGETQQLERGAANDRLAQATGRSIITASGGSEEALEGYRGHGLFTYEVLDAINQADGDGNGTVEINELAAYVYAQVTELSQKVFKQPQAPRMRITSNYPLAKQTRVLEDEGTPVAMAKPNYQLAQVAQLQIEPTSGATVVRSLSAKAAVTLLESRNGWSLIASGGKPLGYVATRDLEPLQ